MYSAEKQDGDAPPPDAGKIIRLGLVAIVGVVTVIVCSFLLSGNMHMWDKSKSGKKGEK